ncbi:hypothetical protein IV203_006436 [Nitzschia inconspicua]|uniref:Uncharacterized protein n=1 Tax=Nitzschia inconspicua TaxID=303405 RepID=A0A9K3PAA3_9STRA|nr:hypothetical protein IV203_006436 [Nitzschia inconspicua]
MSGISSNRSPPTSQSAVSNHDNSPVAIGGTTVEATGAASGVVRNETTAANVVTETELAYIAGNSSLRSLVVLSHGLKKDDGSDLIDIKNEEPWKSIPRIEIKPTADLLKAEIQRRHQVFGLPKPEPRPASWRSSKISKWLFDHPIEKEADLEFLKRTIANCRQQIRQDSRFHRHFERHAPPPGVAATTTDGGESVPSVVTTAGSRTNQTSHSRSNVEQQQEEQKQSLDKLSNCQLTMSGINSNRGPPISQSAESSRDNSSVAIGDTVEAAAASAASVVMTETAANVVTETELAYNAGNNSLRILVVLSHGLKKDDGSDLIDIKNEEPWKSIPRIEIKPTADLFKAEIQRRHQVFGLPKPEPRPASWRSSKIYKWLFDHPIEKEADVDFLKRTIANWRKQISREARVHRQVDRDAPPPAGVATTDGGESVPSVITTAGRTNQASHSRSNVESALENIAVALGNFVKEDRKRRLEDRMDAISAEKRKVRRLLIESRQAGNDELHECYKQELDELDSNERRIQETLETL